MDAFKLPELYRICRTKLGPVLLLPMTLWCFELIKPETGPLPSGESIVRMSIAGMLGVGLWNFDELPNVLGQRWKFRLYVALRQGFCLGMFLLLIDYGDDPVERSIKFLTAAFVYGCGMAFFFKGRGAAPLVPFSEFSVPLLFAIGSMMLVLASFWVADKPGSIMFIASLNFATLQFPVHATLPSIDAKFRLVASVFFTAMFSAVWFF